MFQTRRAQVDADLPQLVFSVTGDSVPLTLSIQNVGRGAALFPGYAVLSGLASGQATKGSHPGNLLPNEKVGYAIPFVTTADAVGVVFTEDRHNNVHVWSNTRKYRQYKKGRKDLTPRRFVRDLYNEAMAARLDSAATWVVAKVVSP